MTHVTCRLTAKYRDQLRNPTLGNRVWATLLLNRGSTDFTPRRILKLVHRGQYRTVGGVCYLRLHCSLLCSVAVGRRHLRVESARVLRRQASLEAGSSFIGQPERLILNELATKLAHPSTKRTTLHNIVLVLFVTDTVLCRATMLQNCTQNNLFHTTSILIFVLCSS